MNADKSITTHVSVSVAYTEAFRTLLCCPNDQSRLGISLPFIFKPKHVETFFKVSQAKVFLLYFVI